MTEPPWVPAQAVITIHDRLIARHGGLAGIRARSLVEAACAQPMRRVAAGLGNLYALSTSYAFCIAKTPAFLDGNKRTGFMTAVTFLRLNGLVFRTDPVEGVRMMKGIAANEIRADAFMEWLRAGIVAITPKP
jgi:death-on-curing protein